VILYDLHYSYRNYVLILSYNNPKINLIVTLPTRGLVSSSVLQQLWRPVFHGCWPKAVEQPSSWS